MDIVRYRLLMVTYHSLVNRKSVKSDDSSANSEVFDELVPIVVRRIFISPAHSYFGRSDRTPFASPMVEVKDVECVAGMGLRGDRFFGYRPDYKGQVTLMSLESFASLRRVFERPQLCPSVLRRNLAVEGVDLNALIGKTFTVQGVRLQAMDECRPCHWMEQAVAIGAEEWLKGRGGLRCRVLSGGRLQSST